MSSERWDVTHSHGEFSCPNIRVWFCGWSVKFVRGRLSLSYSWMIGRIIVVQICWTQIVLLFFVFFQWVWHDCCCLVICLVRLLVEWLVSSVLVVRHSVLLYGARLEMFCSAWARWWHSHNSAFPWRRVLASGVEFPCPSSEGDSWGVVWCKICGTEIRVKFIGWSWWNESVCDATTLASAYSICLCQRFFYLPEICMKLGAARLCYFVFRWMIWVHYCSSKGHQRHPLTKPHNPSLLRGGM